MSFSNVREYSRAILQPIAAVANPSNLLESSDQAAHRLAPTTSSAWTATTHVFQGTLGRFASLSWPVEKFSQDPSAIADEKAYSIEYNVASARAHPQGSEAGVYRLYGEPNQTESKSLHTQVPRIVVKRYTPMVDNIRSDKTSKPKITLLLLPGMGLPKEVFEPMIDGIIVQQRNAGFEVVELWSVDMPMCGETALLNPIGYLYANEKDIARDLLLFITAYLPLQAGGSLPTDLLPRQLSGDARQPVRQDLHIIGHSLGAQSAMLIAAHAPDVFQSLTVFDPAIIPSGKIQKTFTAFPKDVLCMGIDYKHASREALAKAIQSNRRTQGWDDRIKKIYVDRAAVMATDRTLRLASHPRLEWALYYDQETPSHSYDRLADIRVPLNAIMPARPFAVPAKMFEADVAKLPQKTRLTWIAKATHQLPSERIDECTDLVGAWLDSVAGRQHAKL